MAAASGGTALAQTGQPGYTLRVSAATLSPSNPSITVEALAGYDPLLHDGFAGARFSVIASEAGWSDPRQTLLPPELGPSDGMISPDGSRVDGIITGQLGGCGIIGCADPTNPIKLWEATFTIEDFTPRAIELSTLTSVGDYRVYPELRSPMSIAVTPVEGATLVRVIPAPGTTGALALAGGLVMRRRRAPRSPAGATSAG